MSWVSQSQCVSLLRFLEISPLLNNHGNLKTELFCFYSSELKNLKQTIVLLNKTDKAGWNSVKSDDPKTKVRYANTLLNMGLLINVDGSEEHVLSDTAKSILSYVDSKGLQPDNLVEQSYSEDAIQVERIILQNLLRVVTNTDDVENRVYKFGIEILFRLQEFYESCKHLDIKSIINDLELLYFCQAINSTGFEIKKYFSLSDQERLETMNLWRTLADDRDNHPDTPPSNILEKAVYTYTRPRYKKTLQLDIRFRCRNLLNAYLETKSTETIPDISSDLTIVKEYDHNTIGEKTTNNTRKILPLPHQLIVSGCPGSGKSTYLDKQIESNDSSAVVTRITLHPDYGYSDLVGSYKPTPVYQKSDEIFDGSGKEYSKGIPKINYEFISGPLITQYTKARKRPEINYILIIEEINRTNCNTLFGDFFQLLDRKNGISEFSVDAMPDLAKKLLELGLETKIKLPENLYIFATMNAADQGVYPLDSAFRRRWEFQYKGYSDKCEYPEELRKITYGSKEYDWDYFRSIINEKLLSLDIHEDKMIGPYFLKKEELIDSNKVCNKLFLYLWEDVLRFQRQEMFEYLSFSKVMEVWKNGDGEPLSINLDE
ncbi:AAA family ATPase [Shewanella algae]|uniref:AAA family ATPase n=1 Tax=Shewanella algae TaxID=38313 RepID=UPI0031F4EEF2